MTNNDRPIKFYRGGGCRKCRFTGYKGRTVIVELLIPSEKIRDMIISKKHSSEIEAQACSEGMTTLFQCGLDKVAKGITTCEEILRVTKGNVVSE